jgi:hypothetical protein
MMPANAVAMRDAEAPAGPQSTIPATPTAAALPLPAASDGPLLPAEPRLLRTAVARRRRLSLTLLSFLVVQRHSRTPTGRCSVSFCIPGIRGSRVASPFMRRSESRRTSFSAAR